MKNEPSASSSSPNQQYYPISSGSNNNTIHNSSDSSSSSINAVPVLLLDHEADKKRQWTMMIFSITTVLLFADQNLMAPNLTEIAEHFGFDDEERDVKLGGNIALAFWLLGAPAGFLVGVLADRVDRSLLFALTVGIGEGACFFTFFTTTYWELFICRAVTGFSIGGALPLIYSILGDLFPADERHKVSACVGIGTGLGTSVGQGVAGFLGPTFGWRLPFLVVSVPALVCAAIVWKTVEDPERGQLESAVLEHRESRINSNSDSNNIHNYSSADDGNGNEPANGYSENSRARQTSIEMQQLKSTNGENNRNGESESLTQPTATISQVPSPPTIGVRRRSRSLERSNSLVEDSQEKDSLRIVTVGKHSFRAFHQRYIEPMTKVLFLLLKTPTVVLALLQGAPGCLPWGVVNTYLNDFLAEDRGMSVEFATFTVLWFGAGNFFGQLIGGAGGQYLYRIDKRYPALLAGSMAIFGCVPFWVLLNGVNNNSSFIFIAAVALVAGVASGVTGPIIKATLQNVTLPNMRGQAFALFNTFDDFGRGLGPVFVAFLITSVGGRTPAFNLGTLGWVLCGIFNLLVFFTADVDESRAQAMISASLSQRDHSDVLC